MVILTIRLDISDFTIFIVLICRLWSGPDKAVLVDHNGTCGGPRGTALAKYRRWLTFSVGSKRFEAIIREVIGLFLACIVVTNFFIPAPNKSSSLSDSGTGALMVLAGRVAM